MKWLYTISVFIYSFGVFGQQTISFNDNWQFQKGIDTISSKWERVQIPHTWNAEDPFDKIPGYYRGVGWYQKSWNFSSEGLRQFLEFEAINQEATIYVNGKEAGSHLGGYTAFNFDITDYMMEGKNEVLIRVDNSHHENIPPLKGDFNFYGGIYRDVWFIEKNPIHFNLSEYGDHGIFIRTPQVTHEMASVDVESMINNQNSTSTNTVIEHILFDNEGIEVAKVAEKIKLNPGITKDVSSLKSIASPKLWHPEHPYLYRLESALKVDGKIVDCQSNPVGFRWFEFDPDKGFFINGKPLKLMGTNRHQDYRGLGNALSNDRHWNDVELIKDMGSNFFRTAHYPQDRTVLNASDHLGLLVSMEIPLDHEITDSDEFLENSKRMQQEMIRQYYNHPSIIIWAYMNEMMLGRNWDRDQEIIEKIRIQALELEELTRKEDPTRYTMIPNHGALDLYIKAGLTDIPMLVGWNLYYGWYEQDLEGAGKFLDRFHELVPDKPVLITEYGAGADPRIRSLQPERFDFSIEWQNQFHQNNLIQYFERDYLAGAASWNIADFGSESRNDAEPKINSKGVVSHDRKPKDAYFLYQAWLKDDPVVWISSRNWDNRTVKAGETHTIEVYTNAKEVELFLNGESLEMQNAVNNIASWSVMFANGINHLEAKADVNGKLSGDIIDIEVSILNHNSVDWYKGLNINCGATFYFNDPIDQVIWVPDLYFTGGAIYRPRDRGVGSDRTILNTKNDPIYQTHRVAPNHYQFEVTPGTYEVALFWAEVERNIERLFGVFINGKQVFSKVDIQEQAGFSTAFAKKRIVTCDDELKISFQKITGDPMISGIQIRRVN